MRELQKQFSNFFFVKIVYIILFLEEQLKYAIFLSVKYSSAFLLAGNEKLFQAE